MDQQILYKYQLRAIESLGIKTSDLLAGMQPIVVNTGNSFLVIALRNSDVVKSDNPNMAHISAMSEDMENFLKTYP